MAVQSVPSLMGLPKAPYASFAGKTESVAVALVMVPDSVIWLRPQTQALELVGNREIHLRPQTQTIEVI